MADRSLQETLDATAAANTSVGSAVAFIEGLKQQVADFASGKNLAPAVQAGLNQIFDQAIAEQAAVAAALAANVPPATQRSR